MELHDLKPAKGSKKTPKRVGRGPGSGMGKTSTRGHKGQKARSGGSPRRGHEGGQMPIYRRLPKRGFTNIFKKEFQVINVEDLARCKETELNNEKLKAAGLISKVNIPVKVLGQGEVKKAFTIHAGAFSKSAKEKIEAAGGKALVVSAVKTEVA